MLSGAIFIMNELSELDRRRAAIAEARRLYIATGITKNISYALDMYLRKHQYKAQGLRPRISTRPGDQPRTVLDEYIRPKCRKCGAGMYLKLGCSSCKGTVKKNQWICKGCGFIHYTKATLPEILKKLRRKDDGEG